MNGGREGRGGGWLDGWIDRWVGGWMVGWMDVLIGGWMDGWMDGFWMDGLIGWWVGGWMDGWMEVGRQEMNGWIDRSMGGWMNLTGFCLLLIKNYRYLDDVLELEHNEKRAPARMDRGMAVWPFWRTGETTTTIKNYVCYMLK